MSDGDSSRRTIPCPTCRKPVGAPEEAPAFPFCSKKCRLADLSRWLNGEYAIDPATGRLDVIDPDEAEDVTDQMKLN